MNGSYEQSAWGDQPSFERDNMIGALHTLNGGRTLFIWPLRTMILLLGAYHVRGTRI